jgi:hypothetical protein
MHCNESKHSLIHTLWFIKLVVGGVSTLNLISYKTLFECCVKTKKFNAKHLYVVINNGLSIDHGTCFPQGARVRPVNAT